jgi:hypothetical protein
MMMQLYQPLNFMGMVYREIKQAIIDIERHVRHSRPAIPRSRIAPGAPDLVVSPGVVRFENVRLRLRCGSGRSLRASRSRRRRAHDRHRRSVGRRQVDDLAAAVPLLRAARGASPSTGRTSARSRRPRCARRSAWCRRTRCCSTTRSGYNIRYGRDDASDAEVEEAAEHAPDRRLHPLAADGLRDRGRRARLEIVRRREAARRHRPHHPEGAADPGARRGDLGARQPYRTRHPGRAGARLARAHHAGHRAPAVDGRRTPTRSWCSTRASSSSAARTRRCSRSGGLYASMWNRQREARGAREAAEAATSTNSPNRGSAGSDGRASGAERRPPPTPPNGNVHRRLDPRSARADPSRRLSLRRRLRAGEPVLLVAVAAARLARLRRDAVVRLFLPRPAAGDAGARRHRGGAGGRQGQPDRPTRSRRRSSSSASGRCRASRSS